MKKLMILWDKNIEIHFKSKNIIFLKVKIVRFYTNRVNSYSKFTCWTLKQSLYFNEGKNYSLFRFYDSIVTEGAINGIQK